MKDSDGIIRINSFRAAIAAWLDASIECLREQDCQGGKV